MVDVALASLRLHVQITVCPSLTLLLPPSFRVLLVRAVLELQLDGRRKSALPPREDDGRS